MKSGDSKPQGLDAGPSGPRCSAGMWGSSKTQFPGAAPLREESGPAVAPLPWWCGSAHSWMQFLVPHGKCHFALHQSVCQPLLRVTLGPCRHGCWEGAPSSEKTVSGSSEGLTFLPSDDCEASGRLGQLEPLNQEGWHSFLGNLKTRCRTLFKDAPQFCLVDW